MVYTVQKPDVYCYVQYICCYTVACLVFKWMLIIGGTVQFLVVLLNVHCTVNVYSKEMDYHCIEKPYILFLVEYWANFAWMFIDVPNH